ncbi:MAG: penicillin acylase family protein [Actinomycetota bacterium]|nr:penicillin acylase family protein [Actinomycetota bacterium]
MTLLRRLARRSLPRTDGRTRLACLEAPVEVVRDRFGIPHIYASSRLDLARAQGYVHAQDRLFQMETIRRFAFGRLSEIAGARTLDLDRLARRLRLRVAAERDAAGCDEATSALVAAYCEGVNEYLADGPLPVELRLARVRPRPWTPVDVQAPSQMFALTLSGNWESEIARVRLAAQVGAERASRMEPSYPDDHPVTVSPDLAELAPTLRQRGRIGSGASNGWAVAGSRTASGSPLLANDPHLLLGIPGVWHAQHLVWDEGEAAGFTVPGAPVVILGRNARVAWGMTTAMVDTQDLFVERLHPDDPHRYEVDGTWVAAEVVREEIRVRGRTEPFVDEVVVTRHGPIVSQAAGGSGEALALRWSAHEPGETSRSLLDLMVARSVDEADAALARFAAPPHNVVLADCEGAIAYRLAGARIPRRRGSDGRVPVPGWNSEHEWEGWVADEELPRLRDPASGFIVTANNQIVDGEDGPPLHGEYLSGYRAKRIESLLAEAPALTADDCRRIQLDRLSLPGLELAAIARTFSSDDPLEREALALLAGWDGEYTPESRAGAVYGALMRRLEEEAYAEAARDPLVHTEGESLPSGLFERARPDLLRMLAARDDSFFVGERTWEEVFRRALTAAVRDLGPDVSLWRRGRMHRVRFVHAFDAIPGLGRLFNRGPYPAGGDADTVCLLTPAEGAAEGSMIGPSMRAVFDLGDPDGNLISLVPGQSGHPASPHYDDFIPRWLAGELVPLATARERVEELAESRLTLEPTKREE